MAIYQSTNRLAEPQGLEVGGTDGFVTNAADILCASPKVHANLFRGVQRNDLTNVVEQRSDYQFISSPYIQW